MRQGYKKVGDTRRLDATAGADTQALTDWVGDVSSSYEADIILVVDNRGTGDGFLKTATDILDPATKYPAGLERETGPINWKADDTLILDGKLGADLYVDVWLRT